MTEQVIGFDKYPLKKKSTNITNKTNKNLFY